MQGTELRVHLWFLILDDFKGIFRLRGRFMVLLITELGAIFLV